MWERVNAQITNNLGPHRRRPRSEPGVYLLAGLVRCSVCGRSMHGATLKGKPYYWCKSQRPDYADTGHPRTTAIREERILAALDHAGDLAALLAGSERETRARLYQALDLVLNLDPVAEPLTLDVRLQLCGGGGPSCALTAMLPLGR